jgi:hypothetical protein
MELSLTPDLRAALKAIAREIDLTIVQTAGILEESHKSWLRRAVWSEVKHVDDERLIELMRDAAELYRDGLQGTEHEHSLQAFRVSNRPFDWSTSPHDDPAAFLYSTPSLSDDLDIEERFDPFAKFPC